MLFILASLIFGITYLTVKIKSNSTGVSKKKTYVANSDRLINTPIYNQLFLKYRKSIKTLVFFTIISLVVLTGVAMKPVTVTYTQKHQYNRDIVLCLDVSGSMMDTNIEIINKFRSIIDRFKGERLSLVVFNTIANKVFPLTDNYGYINEQFDLVAEGIKGDVTKYNITGYTVRGDDYSLSGDGLTACTQSFDTKNSTEERSRSIIFATDNMIVGTPLFTLGEATDIAIRENIKVYGINPESRENETESQAMSQEVRRTGGEYYPLRSAGLVAGIVDSISAEQVGLVAGEDIISETDTPEALLIILTVTVTLLLFMGRRYKI